MERGPEDELGRKESTGKDEREVANKPAEGASAETTGSVQPDVADADSRDAPGPETSAGRLSPDGAMAASQYNLPEPAPGAPPARGGSRLGETAFIGCLYLVVGFVALALALLFGQIIWRMFFM